MEKKLKIEAVIKDDDIFFTIERSKEMTLIEILGLLNHIGIEVAESIKQKFKAVKF